MTFREDQKNQVQQATDIVRLVGEHVALKPRGKEFLGLCPFHDDKNPSMHVSPVKQIYKCFSCGAGGDVFAFAMNYHKMGFPEAIKYLADKAGIKLEEERQGARGKGQEGPTDRERIAKANAQAVEFYRALLRHSEHGKTAREYIEKRRISPEMVEAFQLGYAPDRWDGLAIMIGEKAWDRRGFELAGLVSKRQTGEGHYDRLRHRLIFPIFDNIGRPIAFGGRKLRDEDEPKYLNSPETLLFNKSATLYGLHLAKKPIIDAKTAVIVEGYTDVIACHQAGVRNVVATLGTALTLQHVQALRHFCEKVVLVYDGDEAGQKASDRAVEVFLTGSLDVAFAVLPDGLDPADLFERPDGTELWDRAIAESTDALEYQFRRVRGELAEAQTLSGRQRIAEEYLAKLAQMGLEQAQVLRKTMIYQRLAELLHLSEPAIQDLLKRLAPAKRPVTAPPAVNAPARNSDNAAADVAPAGSRSKIMALGRAERQLIGCLIRDPRLFHQTMSDGRTLDEAVTPADLVGATSRRLYERIYGRLCDGGELTIAGLLGDLASEGEGELADLAAEAEASVEAETGGDAERTVQMLTQAAAMLLAYHEERQYRETRQAAPADSSAEVVTTVDGNDVMRRLRELSKGRRSAIPIAPPRRRV